MSKAAAPTPPFEPEFIAGLKTIFEERIVFNQVLGLKIPDVARPCAAASGASACNH